MEAKKAHNTASDKYIIQKFNREYNTVGKPMLEGNSKAFNYSKTMEFLEKLGLLTAGANSET